MALHCTRGMRRRVYVTVRCPSSVCPVAAARSSFVTARSPATGLPQHGAQQQTRAVPCLQRRDEAGHRLVMGSFHVSCRPTHTQPVHSKTLCSKKTSTFFEQLCQKLTDFNDFGTLNSAQIWHKRLTDLSTSPVKCNHFTSENPKMSFSTVLFIHTADYLCARYPHQILSGFNIPKIIKVG